MQGEKAQLADVVRGRVAVIDLWASWCDACRAVSARAARLARAHPPDRLAVVGVAVGEERSVVEGFLRGAPAPYPIFLDPAFDFADELGEKELPTVLVVDRKGSVRLVSHDLDAEVVQLVGRLLEEQ